MKEQLARQPRPVQPHTASRLHTTNRSRPENNDEEACSSLHRTASTDGFHSGDTSYTPYEQRIHAPVSQVIRRPPTVEEDEVLNDDVFYPQRLPSSTRRYWPVEEQGQQVQQQTRVMQHTTPQTVIRYHYQQQRSSVPARSSRTQVSSQTSTKDTSPIGQMTQDSQPPIAKSSGGKDARKHRFSWHPLTYIGLTVLAGVIVFVTVSSFFHWWQSYQDDLHYGRPRTFQCDVRVGHNDAHVPSHFIALNLRRQIEIIEFPGDDATKARVYPGPTLIGDGQDLTPVTLSFKDVNGDGKLDMLVHVGTDSTIVYLNDNGTFRLATATDHVTI